MIGYYIYTFINIVVFILYGVDKWKAVHNKWRISEGALILAALLGPFGAILGMYFFHHKVRKPKFSIGVPAIMIIEMILAALVLM